MSGGKSFKTGAQSKCSATRIGEMEGWSLEVEEEGRGLQKDVLV